MFKKVSYHQWPRDTNFAERIDLVDRNVKKKFRLRRTSLGLRIWDNSFHLVKSDRERYTCDTHKEFMQVLNTVPHFKSFDWHSTYAPTLSLAPFSMKRYGVGIDFTWSEIDVAVHADNNLGFIEEVHTLIKDLLDLSNPVRVDKDEYKRKMLDPTIFVARHFDEQGNRYYSNLADFLYLLGFNVVQGEEYSSEGIPEKVKRRIELQDIAIVVVSGIRDHSWLLSEASFALGKGKHLILMVETDASLETALLGKDFEYIRFP